MKRKEVLGPRLELHEPKSGPSGFLISKLCEWMGRAMRGGPISVCIGERADAWMAGQMGVWTRGGKVGGWVNG